jgi:ABC-type taurine transport system ATPase subunit
MMSKRSDETVAAIDALTRKRMMRGVKDVLGPADKAYLQIQHGLGNREAGKILASTRRSSILRRMRWGE